MSAFCEHLDRYGARFVQAEAAYIQLSSFMDRIIDEGPSENLLDLVERALVDWQTAVENLRERFAHLVREGVIRLPATGIHGDEDPEGETAGGPAGESVCGVCGAAVPRLTWPEWDVNGAPAPTYRGSPLSRSGLVSVP